MDLPALPTTRPDAATRVSLDLRSVDLAVLVRFAAKDPGRANLHCIAFYADGTAAATDGHRLVLRIPTLNGGNTVEASPTADRGKPALLAYTDAKQIVKLAGARGNISLSAVGVQWTVYAGSVTIRFDEAEHCTFPPVQQVASVPVPIEKRGFKGNYTFGIAAGLLGDTMTTLSKVHYSRKLQGVKVQVFSPLDPMHISCPGDGASWFAVVMPCHI